MELALRVSLVLALLAPLAGCRRAVRTTDAGRADAAAVDGGPARDPDDLYLECDLAVGCSGVDQVCFPIRGNGRETAWCTYRCDDDDDCPFGICVRDFGTVDDGPRCHETCASDRGCTDPSFGCYRVGLMSTRGNYEADLCFPAP